MCGGTDGGSVGGAADASARRGAGGNDVSDDVSVLPVMAMDDSLDSGRVSLVLTR